MLELLGRFGRFLDEDDRCNPPVLLRLLQLIRSFAVVEQRSIFRELSERCLFIELRGKPSELFCCCGTFRGLQRE